MNKLNSSTFKQTFTVFAFHEIDKCRCDTSADRNRFELDCKKKQRHYKLIEIEIERKRQPQLVGTVQCSYGIKLRCNTCLLNDAIRFPQSPVFSSHPI